MSESDDEAAAKLTIAALKKCTELLEDQIRLLKQEKATYEAIIERYTADEDGSGS